MDNLLSVSSSPHIRSGGTTQRIMLDVLLALIPATAAGVYFFGPRTLLVIGVTVLACLCFEYLTRRLLKRSNTLSDLSAAVTGLLLALNLSPTIPLWMAVIGAFFAIVIVKQLYGGIGQNFVNPALAARVILLVAYGARMTDWVAPFSGTGADAISQATPLSVLKEGGVLPQLSQMFLGLKGGSIGETSALALLIGGAYLIVRGVISWHIPVVYIGTVGVFSWVLGTNGLFTGEPFYQMLAGGLMLGAIFMATDYTTSPMTRKGVLIYAFGCGLLTVVFRNYTNLPEGVSYAILLMNIVTPLIDRYTLPKRFGGDVRV